ncbi:MAG TPA: aldo/keto reductase [Streptosporangiaceae bacterium]|nr:aldo/keto reductase [Streptosporangiaceae bacterium]
MPLDHYVTLGRSGLRVSPFALGAMTFGEDPPGAGSGVAESAKILATYLDRGGNFVDTANFYTNGHSERILGDFFAATPTAARAAARSPTTSTCTTCTTGTGTPQSRKPCARWTTWSE